MNEFKSDRSSSNQTGVTLMNNQVGYVVAQVMADKKDVTMRVLPSMIRVDGINTIDFDFAEIADALGWDDFGNDDFEEIMSTHYGRMVVLDDRVLMFANPEDAAEYIGFDLQPVWSQVSEKLIRFEDSLTRSKARMADLLEDLTLEIPKEIRS